MSSRVVVSDQVITALEGLDNADLDFVLSVIEARFPKGKRSSGNTGGRGPGRGSGRGGANPGRGGRGYAQSRPEQNTGGYGRGGGAGAPDPAQGAGPAAVPRQNVVPTNNDILMDVLQQLSPITGFMEDPKRDPSADIPGMTRKAVQTRLNKKRGELQKALALLSSSSVDGYYGFESANAIQKFRLAAADANATADVRLRTNPLPDLFAELIEPIKAIIAERKQENEISIQGFYTNSDSKYRPPEEHEDGGDI